VKSKAFVSLLVIFALSIPVAAQQPQPQKPKPASEKETKPAPNRPQAEPEDDQDSVVRITTNLVQVDAVVTKDGRVVTDLTPTDFAITEDGRPQTITHFSYVSNVPTEKSEPAQPASSTNAAVVLPAVIRREQTRRTIAIVVDDLGISLDSMRSVKDQLRKFVDEHVQPNDLVAIIRTGGEVGALQQFTTDRRLLHRAIESLRWNLCSRVGYSAIPSMANMTVPDENLGSGQNAIGLCADLQGGPLRGTVRALRFILAGMRDLPGRKAMVLLSDSLPLDLPKMDSLERGPIKAEQPIDDSPNVDLVRNEAETQFGN
jgi:VWFA-related protein